MLEVNPDYKGPDKPYFKRIIAKPISEPKTAVISFLAKELAFTEIEPTALPQVEADADSATIKLDGIDYTWVGINVEKPPYTDIRVRRAIRYGIDVDAIIAGAYSGTVSRANSLLAPGLLGHWDAAPVYKRDVDKAKALLAEAGQTSFSTTFTCLNDATSQAVAPAFGTRCMTSIWRSCTARR